jgi:hypothetical protein
MTARAHGHAIPAHRLVDYAGRTLRIPADCSVSGAVDLDEQHALVVMKRLAHPRRHSLWPEAVTLRVFRQAGMVWVQRPPSVTLPAGRLPELVAALAQAEEPEDKRRTP